MTLPRLGLIVVACAVISGVLVYATGRGSDGAAAITRSPAAATAVARAVAGSSTVAGPSSVAGSGSANPGASASPVPKPAPARRADPLGPAAVFMSGRLGTVRVAVYDISTHQTWTAGETSRAQDEASIVKVDVLETLLDQQPAGLTSEQAALAQQMIEESNNDAATALWDTVGGAAGLRAFNARAGLTGTTPSACVECAGFPWPGWGLTTTTPVDQLKLLRELVTPDSVLSAAQRKVALGLMEDVTPDQRWGVSGGVPAQVTVALKDGWLPLNAADTDWQINSIGWVHGASRDYLIAVLSTGNPSEAYGIDTIDELSAMIWRQLGS
jgi:hypothetical protein